MSNKYIISDLHIGHKNMAKRRGFGSIELHDQYIIDRWNSTVSKKDVVIIPGDITMEKASFYAMLNLLNGIKKVVLGNHEKANHVPRLLDYVNSVCGCIVEKNYIITHIPIHESQLDRFEFNIHGHVHSETLDDPRYINVSAEALDYTPILLTDLINSHVKKPRIKKSCINVVCNDKSR